MGNRVAVSSLDYALSVYNLHPESGLTHYKDMMRFDQFDANKIEFNPNGNEIISGTLSLKVYDVTSGEVVQEMGQGSKFIQSVAYVK